MAVRWKHIVFPLGVAVIGIGGLLFWHPQWSSVPVSPMKAMVQSNQRASHQFLVRLARRDPSLLASRGHITFQDIGLTARTARVPGISPANQIKGTHTIWNQNASYLTTRRHQLGATAIPTGVWLAGLRQAARDLTMLVGNDPLAAVLNAGPGTAPKFWQLEHAMYAGPMSEFTHPHWNVRVMATTLPYPHGPSLQIYPVTHQVPGAPTAVILLRVPVILNEIEVVSKPHSTPAVQSVVQTGEAIMGLTHSTGRWQWWAEQITIHATTNTLGTPSK